jgi:hypothetical protein
MSEDAQEVGMAESMHHGDSATDGVREAGVNRALLGGLLAAVLGGVAWAVIVITTGYEIGWAAWAIGLLVGIVMAKLTAARGPSLATPAAIFAAAGLLTGKVFIVEYGTERFAVDEIQADPSLMQQAALHDLDASGTMPEPIQTQLEAMADSDTLSDALWLEMLDASSAHAEQADPAERERIAVQYAQLVLGSIGLLEQLQMQLSAWDLLWLALAVTTAWRMLRGREHEVVEEPEVERS